jgi:hypothetical protein
VGGVCGRFGTPDGKILYDFYGAEINLAGFAEIN